jgi:hypothetical protein
MAGYAFLDFEFMLFSETFKLDVVNFKKLILLYVITEIGS